MINILKNIIILLINFIEKIEYRGKSLNEDDITKKILSSLRLENMYVDTDTGW